MTLDTDGSPETVRAPLIAERYEIVGLLGGGGMGTVYRANDKELGEVVALKLLRRELASSSELLERFRREVRLARKVTHPNVVRTFDIGTNFGEPFLTMELVEGESLAELLGRRGRLPASEMIPIALQICDGLHAAHAAKIVHRDLKPENILIDRAGRVLITDFGVAHAVVDLDHGPRHGSRHAFGVAGTPAYMAPEQVEGAATDGRADVYALGAILYEMATGRVPWDGVSVLAIAAARLVQPPPDPRVIVPDISPPLARLILSCMARMPAERCSSAREVAITLAEMSISGGREAAGEPLAPRRARGSLTVAVLPLSNFVGPEETYFCRGVAEDIVDGLTGKADVRIRHHVPETVDRTNIEELGRVLGVCAVIDGVLRRRLGKLCLDVRLVSVDSGFQIWARRFEGATTMDLVASGRAAAEAIAMAIASTGRSDADVATDSAAHELHMRGRFAYQRGWYEGNVAAMRLLADAHARAPNDARIASTYALSLAREYGLADGARATAERARVLAESALRRAPSIVDAHVALAALHIYDCEPVAAAAELRRALATFPDNVEALDWTGRLLTEADEVPRGLAYLERAAAIEPTMEGTKLTAALVRGLLGDWDGAAEGFRIPPADPVDRVLFFLYRARLAVWRRDTGAAASQLAEIMNADELGPAQAMLGGLLRIGTTGRIEPDDAALIETVLPTSGQLAPRRAVINAQFRAEVFARAGRFDDARAALLDADAAGLWDVVWLTQCPLLSDVRGSADVQAVLRHAEARAARIRTALLEDPPSARTPSLPP